MQTWDRQGERRAFPRRTARGTARYRDPQQRALMDFPAQVVDLSQAGVGLLVREPLAAGQVIALALDPPTGRPLVCEVVVRWAEARPDGWYRLGGPLERRLSYADLQKLS